VHELGGFGSFREYVEHVFGFTGRQTEERLRVAEALERLPGLSVEMARGRVCWSVARELSRVATEENEVEWIEVASGKTAHEVESMVSGRTIGDAPDAEVKPEARMHRLSLRVSASTYALWQEARRVLVAESGAGLDDEALVAAIARRVLGAPKDEGRSNYQVAIHLCERCRHATQRAGSAHVTIDDVMLETACCDAQHLGRVDAGASARARQGVPPAVRRRVIARHQHRCAVPGCRGASYLDVHHTVLRSEGGDHDPEFLVPLCPAHHRCAHEGTLVVRGSFGAGLVFEHADGRAYGSRDHDGRTSRRVAEVFRALCALGFEEREARGYIDAARPHVGGHLEASEMLREVLRRIPNLGASRVREARVEYAPQYG
jgi:hypothetical protein